MQRGIFSFLRLATLLFIAFSFSQPTWAGKVVKVKGKKVYIKLSKSEKGQIMVGDKLIVRRKGKKKATVRVTKVKKRNVRGKLLKGKVRKGYTTKLRKKKKKSGSSSYDSGYASGSDLRFGLLAGYGLASQQVNQGTDGTSEQGGSSIAVKGMVDYSLIGDFGIRAQIGAEMFSVSGDGVNVSKGVEETIGTDITYLSIDVLIRYRFMLGTSAFAYLNAGVGIFSPLSQSSTALDEASISTTSIIMAGGGIGFAVGNTDIFFGADYYYFPPSEDVNTTVISPKLGVIFNL